MSPPELGNPVTAGPEHCNTAEAQGKDLKIVFKNMTEVLKEEMTKSLKEVYENTNKQWKEMNKTVQDLKVEIESIKKTQREGNVEINNLGTPQRQASPTEYKKREGDSQALKAP
jgi:predicted nucleotide-binding protein (sugar kinase/HSP70/actin superfamily)